MMLAAFILVVLLESAFGAQYTVKVQTTDEFLAGTNADVFITIYGGNGNTAKHELESGGDDFERGKLDTFHINDDKDVGLIHAIVIRRTDGGSGGKWRLDEIRVISNKLESYFKYNSWVDKNKDITITVSSCGSGSERGVDNGNPVCKDVNECALHACGDHADCTNTVGSFSCKCHSGYEKQNNLCVDTNECNDKNGGCDQKCVNTPGSFYCECDSGYRLQTDKRTCLNINECVENNPCVDPATCVDDQGTYHCNCPQGYVKKDRHNCEDRNECLTSNACNVQMSTCENLPGKYRCKCKSGFTQDGDFKCKDIDECAPSDNSNLNTCDLAKSDCVNSIPGFYCKCKKGYRQGKTNKICVADVCGPLASVYGGSISPARCQQDKANDYGDKCVYACNKGYQLADPNVTTRTCGQHGVWQGQVPICNRVKCPALTAVANSYLSPPSCATTGGTYGGICTYVCKSGHSLSGNPERQCQADNTWNGAEPTCSKVFKDPWISCPQDIEVDLKQGESKADVSSLWKMPTSNIAPITVSPASAATNFVYPAGESKVKFTVSNSVATKSCYILVTVNDNEKPKVLFCPSAIHKTSATLPYAVTWDEPRFSDNVLVTSVTKTHSSGDQFGVGVTPVTYEASDAGKNKVQCKFDVNIKREGCPPIEIPSNVIKSCRSFGPTTHYCSVKCPSGMVLYKNPSTYSYWTCYATSWTPTPRIPECVVATPVADANVQCDRNRVNMAAQTTTGLKNYCAECPSGHYKQGSECQKCPAGQYQDTQGGTVCKKCPSGTYSSEGAASPNDCRVVCGAGKFSKDGLEPGCEVCPMDTYQDGTRSTSCKACPAGTKTLHTACTKADECGVAPVISRVTPAPQTIDEGENVEISCYVTGKPRPSVSVKFTKTINPSFLGRVTTSYIHQGGENVGLKMTITGATYENNGRYECTAENSFGKVKASANLVVQKVLGSGGGGGSADESLELDLLE